VRSIEIAGFLSNMYRSLFLSIQISFMRSNLLILRRFEGEAKRCGVSKTQPSFHIFTVSFHIYACLFCVVQCATENTGTQHRKCRLLACRVFL